MTQPATSGRRWTLQIHRDGNLCCKDFTGRPVCYWCVNAPSNTDDVPVCPVSELGAVNGELGAAKTEITNLGHAMLQQHIDNARLAQKVEAMARALRLSLEFFEARDHMNAAVHATLTRWSPVTITVREALSGYEPPQPQTLAALDAAKEGEGEG